MTKKTHLYEFHRQHAKMEPFAGFEMPLWYKGIIPEHLTVRNSVGIFDISHMGRFLIRGIDAIPFMQHVLTNNVVALDFVMSKMSSGTARSPGL